MRTNTELEAVYNSTNL